MTSKRQVSGTSFRVLFTATKDGDTHVVQTREVANAIEVWTGLRVGSAITTIELKRFTAPKPLEDYLLSKREEFEEDGWEVEVRR